MKSYMIAALLSLFCACTTKTMTPVEPEASSVGFDHFEVAPDPSADVLFVLDDSNSMSEEQASLMANLSRFVGKLGTTGAPLRFATVTTNPSGQANQDGDFFTHPALFNGLPAQNRDIRNGANILRDIPDAFCDEVMARAEGGVLSTTNPQLQSLLTENGVAGDLDLQTPGIQIPDFTGRLPGTIFIDADGTAQTKETPNQNVTAEFVDMVGCIIAVGIQGDGFEAGLCKMSAALDSDSLKGKNSAFLQDPESVLAVIIVGDEDDCTTGASIVNNGGSVLCESPDDITNSRVGSQVCSQRSTEDICGEGLTGRFDLLVPVDTFTDSLAALRPQSRLFVAEVSGPPAAALSRCDGQGLPVPSCTGDAGTASPGNRFFEFTKSFTNRVDSFNDLTNGICEDFDGAINQIADGLAQVINTSCLPNAPIDVANFDIERDALVLLDITNAEGISSCADLRVDTSLFGLSGAQDGDEVAEPFEGSATTCVVKHDPNDGVAFLELVPNEACDNHVNLEFVDFAIPNGTLVTVEYVADPQ